MAAINYDDVRFKEVKKEEKAALGEVDKTYDGMINQSDSFFQSQIDASNQYAETQKKNQQEQTDFAIEQIEQEKAQTKKDYIKEQAGAYADWQKQSDPYGVQAEKMAQNGLINSGYSESAQVSMYNTYQNRVATARESYNLAVQSYNNSITQARLQNNSILAEIAYNALQQQLSLSLQGFQYKNQLILDKANQKTAIRDTYYDRYLGVVNQINTENAFAEEQRQYNENLRLQQEELAEKQRQYNESLKLQQEELAWDKEKEKKKSSTISNTGSPNGSNGNTVEINKDNTTNTSNPTKTKKEEAVNNLIANNAWRTQGTSNNTPSLKIDTSNILDLGYGPISAKKLNELVDKGEVIEYIENGVIKFRKNIVKSLLNTTKKYRSR